MPQQNKRLPANWVHWKKMLDVTLEEAVCLAFNIEPGSAHVHDLHKSPFSNLDKFYFGDEFRPLYKLALSAISEGSLYKRGQYRYVRQGIPCVRLSEFGAWAKKNGVKLPEDFPISRTERIQNKDKVRLVLPYECPFLEKVAEIMFKNYASLGPNDKPNQKKVSLEIDELVPTWSNQEKGVKGSRPAVSIAKMIQPERFQT